MVEREFSDLQQRVAELTAANKQLQREADERKAAEEKAERLNALLRAVRNVNQTIAREKDRDRLIEMVCGSLGEAFGRAGVWIALLGESGELITAAQSGLGPAFARLVDRIRRGQWDRGERLALSQSGAVLLQGEGSRAGEGAAQAPLAAPNRLAVRLECAGRVLGLLVSRLRGDAVVVEEERRLFEEVAADVALALHGILLDQQRRNAEESLRLEQSRLEALLQLNQMAESSTQEIADFALEEAVRLTRSRIGYLAFMNDDETVLTMHSWSKSVMEQCAVIDKPIVYPVETTGLWGEAVRQRKPVITNDYSAPNPRKKGYPEGHVPVVRHMNVPVFDGDRIVAVAGVGNKEAPYDDSDVRELTLLMQGMWRLLQRKRADESLREAREQLERRVKERTAELAAANEDLKREIAERKRAEEDLAYERFLLVTLLERSPDFIYYKDADSRFIRISTALARYYGLEDPAEAVGKSDFDFFGPEEAAQYLADEREIMRTGRPIVDKEEEQTWPDGRKGWVSTTKLPLYDPGGKIVGTFGISRDITDRKQVELQLQGAKEAAEAASRAKSDFLANMSHEVRTPMNAIIGLTELLLDTELTASQRDYLKMVQESGESLLSVINDILDFSKIEAGKLDLDRRPFELRECLGDTMKSLSLRAHSKGLELACHVRADVPDWLVGDAGRLRQIVVNLVGNAIKFTDSGEVVLEVERRSEEGDEAALHFAVTDTGVGVPEEKRAAIFEAFEQADSSTTRRFGGTGLGLAISSRLVQLMKGRIWLESEVGRGSTFHFTARFERARGEGAKPPPSPPAVVRGARILVVDDNATNRHILHEMLSNWGMKPTLAAGGREALRLLRQARRVQQSFSLVLTDANMPDLDGFQLIEQVKNDDQLGGAVLMMLTSGDRPGDVARCEQLGVAAYLLKPVKQSELFDAIAMALNLVHPEDEPAGQPAASPARQLPPLRILLAEDSLVNQKLAVGLLQKYGHSVVVANHGREALAAWETQPFDVVLMDVQMPEMDGFEATAVIRAKEQRDGGRIPIIAMTAHAMKGDRERCLEAGMDGYISKPIRARQVFETIAETLGAARSSRTSEAAVPRSEDPIDWPAALEAADGDQQLLKIGADTFIEQHAELMTAIRDAAGTDDAGPLRKAAHTLKGALSCFGETAALKTVRRIEQHAAEDDIESARQTLAALETEITQLVRALSDFVDGEQESIGR